jgi:hypothetical protein
MNELRDATQYAGNQMRQQVQPPVARVAVWQKTRQQLR